MVTNTISCILPINFSQKYFFRQVTKNWRNQGFCLKSRDLHTIPEISPSHKVLYTKVPAQDNFLPSAEKSRDSAIFPLIPGKPSDRLHSKEVNKPDIVAAVVRQQPLLPAVQTAK